MSGDKAGTRGLREQQTTTRAGRHKPDTSLSTSLLLILPLVAALELNLPLVFKGQLCHYPTPVYEEGLALPTESTSADCVDQKTVQVALRSHPT